MKRRYVLIGLGMLAAVALVSTAIAGSRSGGKSGAISAKSKSTTVAQVAKKKKVKRGPAGPQGPPGPAGAPGAPGAPGASPVMAFAQVNGAGAPNTVVDSTASGIADANVVRQAAGLYCIHGLSFTPKVIVATPALYPNNIANTSELFTSTTLAAGDSGDCPNTPSMEQGEIYFDGDGNPGTFAGTDASFMLTIY
jgi:hypothetical protein